MEMDRNVVLSGNLHFLGIPELLQLLATNVSTGVLRLTNPHAWASASVAFLSGNPVYAEYGSASGLEALYALFGWATGHFEFSREKVNTERAIHENHMEIVLEGLRLLDEGLTSRLGPGSEEKGSPGQIDSASRLPLIRKPITHYPYMATEEHFSKGTSIIEEGEFGNWIWVVLGGTAEMTKKTIAGPTKILRVGQGAYIGNISSMIASNIRRITTFTATETVYLGVLDPEPVYAESSSFSREFKSVLLSIDNRLREITKSLSDTYSGTHMGKKAFRSPKNQPGKGKRGQEPFLISKGNVTIIQDIKNETFPLINLHPGDVFGPLPFLEMGLEPSSASVFFSDDLEFFPLDSEELQREYDQLSDTLKSIIDFSLNCISIATMTVYRRCMEQMKNNDSKRA